MLKALIHRIKQGNSFEKAEIARAGRQNNKY